MKYTFPHIEHIDDVLPKIEGREDFFVAEQDGGFTVINYMFEQPDSFDCHIRRECRGLKFNTNSGKIIQRPFHKFFNIGEKEETHPKNINMDDFTPVMKLDGSMIAPIILPDTGELRLTTKMGLNKVSEQAEFFMQSHPLMMEWCIEMIKENKTPIFEWCSMKNRIVLNYNKENLVLLTIRDNHTGIYQENTDDTIYKHNNYIIPEVSRNFIAPLPSDIRNAEDIEGIVLVDLSNGHRMKMKSDWYVNLHKIKSDIAFEHNLVNLIMNDNLDDIIPVLDNHTKEDIEVYSKELFNEYNKIIKLLENSFLNITSQSGQDRKEFASLVKLENIKVPLKSILFQMMDGKCVKASVKKLIINNCLKKIKWVQFKKNMELEIKDWNGAMFSDLDG